ncbi:MAG: T9SS type A sorting domain-containing protein [Bacteroidales bacterium]|nr:T9SS type A sorting domain-containing protein [Bacteroidales bacterium]MCF8333951.1 T9SS type A sorting domain-containing protein [Bacteroidales bacterium]
MKRIVLFSLLILFSTSLLAQKSHVSKDLMNKSVKVEKKESIHDIGSSSNTDVISLRNTQLPVEETQIGESWYDLQSNAALSNRIYKHSDGTMAAVWTMGLEDGVSSFPERGAGYNYYNGSEWGEYPTERVEDERCGWPNYAPLGDNGEIIVSHTGTVLKVSTRENKGTGDWNYSELEAPDGYDIIWPRMITNGNTIHVVGVLPNVANGGEIYEGLDGAIVYFRSTDGGETWVDENVILPGMTSDDYIGFSADEYIWATNGDVTALIVTSLWYGHDTFVMKTEDGGETWDKTVIWENPYNDEVYADIVTTPDTLWAPDGTLGADIDSDGNVHVSFGLNRAYKEETGDDAQFSVFPFAEGIVYWNETMEPFTAENQHDALSWDNLEENETLVGWMPDIDGNGQLDMTIDNLYTYIYSASTMPTLTIDDNDDVFLAYATPREDLGDDLRFRHIFGRAKVDGYWFGDPNSAEMDLTGGEIHFYDECIFPVMANMQPGDESVNILYQRDNLVGFAVGTEPDHEFVNNAETIINATRHDFGVFTGIANDNTARQVQVSQNMPNPFRESTTISVQLPEAANLSIEVINMVGQTVYKEERGQVNAGTKKFTIPGKDLEKGIYLYNVKVNGSVTTQKMVVE